MVSVTFFIVVVVLWVALVATNKTALNGLIFLMDSMLGPAIA